MKFSWERESDEGFCTITAMPDGYDAFPPVQVLSMDYIPRLVAQDRLAVSCILAFGHYSSGAMHLMAPVSAELATAAELALEPATVSIPTVDYMPKAMIYGSNMFKLNAGGRQQVALHWAGFGTPREFELRMTSMSENYTSSFSNEVLQVPTNAHLVSTAVSSVETKLLPYLAQAVLLAEDLDVGIIKLPAGLPRSNRMVNIGAFLQTCGLILQFTD